MFAEKFGNLITKYPQEADAFGRLGEYFYAFELKSGAKYKDIKLEPGRLFDIAQAGSTNRLARVIEVLVNEKVLRPLLIVESPSGGGVATYTAFSDIPLIVHDVLRDVDLEVSIDDIRTVYTPSE